MKNTFNTQCYLKKSFQCAIIVMLLFFSQRSLLAQSCFPNGIAFENQSDITFFQLANPECTIIQGDVYIGLWESNDIVDLTGLNKIKVIEGDLIINKNDQLVNLNGLDSLYEIQGDLLIANNNSLKTIDSPKNLQVVNGTFLIIGNNELETIDGLSSLTNVGDLTVEYNLSLKNLNGLSNIQIVSRDLTIQGNELLVNLEGLSSLDFIGGDFIISNNFSLKNLTGLSAEAYKGLETLSIIGNQYLESLEGLDNFNLIGLTELVIRNNPNLSLCNVKSICDFIASHRIPDLSQNKNSCTVEYIERTCIPESIEDYYDKYPPLVFPNPATDWLEVQQANYFRTPIHYEIIDLNNETVLAGFFDSLPINVSSLSQGMFFIKIGFIDKDVIYRFVKN